MSVKHISAVILNWLRPQNLPKIAAAWQESGLVDDVVIWNNNPQSEIPGIPGATIVQSNADLGLNTRFAAACLAKHEAVLIQDDDLILPPATLQRLFQSWQQDPSILHGIIGRRPREDNTYAHCVRRNQNAPIVLTRALITHRRYAADFFRFYPQFIDIQRDSVPHGNGEDIIFSYVVRRLAGRLHRIHRLPVRELRDRLGISDRDRKGHLGHRTRLMQACESWLAAEA